MPVALVDRRPVATPAALLIVVAARLYDRQIPVISSGVPLDAIFDDDMRAGGFRKTCRRAISRVLAVNRSGTADG